MKETEFRKLVREEIKSIMSEMPELDREEETAISQIYNWIIQGNMKQAVAAMQNDPELLSLANDVVLLKKELIKRMAKDEKFGIFLAKTIEDMIASKKNK